MAHASHNHRVPHGGGRARRLARRQLHDQVSPRVVLQPASNFISRSDSERLENRISNHTLPMSSHDVFMSYSIPVRVQRELYTATDENAAADVLTLTSYAVACQQASAAEELVTEYCAAVLGLDPKYTGFSEQLRSANGSRRKVLCEFAAKYLSPYRDSF